MRVGVDATSWVNRRGYGRFVRNAVRSLLEIDDGSEYVLFIDDQSAERADLPEAAEHRRISLRKAPSRAAAASSSRPLGDLLRLSWAVRQDSLDVFLFPSVYTYFPVFGLPTIVGIHDVIATQFPTLTLPSRRARAFWRAKETLALRRAARVFTVSEASRMELAGHFGLAPERFAVVPEAPDPVFRPREEAEIVRRLSSIGLSFGDTFLLFAGGISPHKNIETLLEAYASLGHSRTEVPGLVVVGDLSTDSYHSAAESVRESIRRLELGDDVLLPGYVSDETLACLYTAATAVVLPSLAEGFGLPAVEAAACGAPLVLSDLSVHREVVGDAALYFPAKDARALEAQLSRIIDESNLRRSLIERGQARVEGLSWEITAECLRELLVEAKVNG